MAHTACINNHGMWNGDGKPIVWAFRLDFIKKFQQEHPDVILGSERYYAIYDCFEDALEEDLDCWYCDECGALAVFLGDERWDFFPVKLDPMETIDQESSVYIAMRDEALERFSAQSEGKRPYDALISCPDYYKCYVTRDWSMIRVFTADGRPKVALKLVLHRLLPKITFP